MTKCNCELYFEVHDVHLAFGGFLLDISPQKVLKIPRAFQTNPLLHSLLSLQRPEANAAVAGRPGPTLLLGDVGRDEPNG